jgi:hypothetical protein
MKIYDERVQLAFTIKSITNSTDRCRDGPFFIKFVMRAREADSLS